MDDVTIIVGIPDWNKATQEQKEALAIVCFELFIRSLLSK